MITSSSELQCDWTRAEPLLRPYDRFMRAEIERDFPYQVGHGGVVVDLDEGLKATPVADNRFTVVWRWNAQQQPEVVAVAAAQFRDEKPADLRRKLEQVIEAQSHGRVQLSP